jgi:hypothetical protein
MRVVGNVSEMKTRLIIADEILNVASHYTLETDLQLQLRWVNIPIPGWFQTLNGD